MTMNALYEPNTTYNTHFILVNYDKESTLKQALQQVWIREPPPVIICWINYVQQLHYSLDLDDKFVDFNFKLPQAQKFQFSLFGCVVSRTVVHYVAYVELDNQWVEFDDSYVQDVQEYERDRVKRINCIQKPVLLFYRRQLSYQEPSRNALTRCEKSRG